MKIIFTKNFKKSIFKLEKSIQVRIIEKLDLINQTTDDIYELNLDIKKLQPKEK
jgi:flagellar hook-associated protein FlgK